MRACVCVSVRACVRSCVRACVRAGACVRARACVRACACVCVHVRAHVRVDVRTYVFKINNYARTTADGYISQRIVFDSRDLCKDHINNIHSLRAVAELEAE